MYKEFSRLADEHPAPSGSCSTIRQRPPAARRRGGTRRAYPEALLLRRNVGGRALARGARDHCRGLQQAGHQEQQRRGRRGPGPLLHDKGSAIKQIASGRFGVTPAYLASAADLEIKIAQGAKPGEGGHLPGDKVTGLHRPAQALQARHDAHLSAAPPRHLLDRGPGPADPRPEAGKPAAHVCVKLVAEAGVGTVAAGVAKSYADIVQISGCEGGTGAASVTSIKNAGSHWETGLVETVRVLEGERASGPHPGARRRRTQDRQGRDHCGAAGRRGVRFRNGDDDIQRAASWPASAI